MDAGSLDLKSVAVRPSLKYALDDSSGEIRLKSKRPRAAFLVESAIDRGAVELDEFRPVGDSDELSSGSYLEQLGLFTVLAN